MDKELLNRLCEFERDANFPDDLAKTVKLLVLDVDGVLTDGGLYYGDNGLSLKRFDVQDGLGIKLAQRAGIEIAIISGMESAALQHRARTLGIKECHAGFVEKLPKLEAIMNERGLSWSELAYLGDDIVDLSVMRMVGLSLAVHNAQPEVRAMANYVTPCSGGAGAVRWVIRHILLAQGRLPELLAEFL